MAAERAFADAAPDGATDMLEGRNPMDAATVATGPPASSSGGVWEAAALIGDQAAERLTDLEQQRKRLHAEKEALTKDIRNTERKRLRLKDKARGLTDLDLMDIIATRAAAKAKSHTKAAAKTRAAP